MNLRTPFICRILTLFCIWGWDPLNAKAEVQERELLDLKVLEEIAILYDEGQAREDFTEARAAWTQVLETSVFHLPPLPSGREGNPLIDREMPASKPRWETGRRSFTRPFAYEELREPSKSDAEFAYFNRLEEETFRRGIRIARLRANADLLRWTDSWIASKIFLSSSRSKKVDRAKCCEDIRRGLAARALLRAGRAGDDSHSLLLIYGLSVGHEMGLHLCPDLPKLSWGLKPLKHPRTGMVEIDQYTGERSSGSAANFAKILSGTYIQQYDWVVTYDEKTLFTQIDSERSLSLRSSKLELNDTRVKKNKQANFHGLIKHLAAEQHAFEKSYARRR